MTKIMKTTDTTRSLALSGGFKAIALAALATGICASASAANINQIESAPNSNTSWATASLWDGNQAPSAANDYFNNNHLLYTATTETSTFNGNSLTVSNTGMLGLKANIVNVSTLTLNNGIIRNATNRSGNEKSAVNINSLTVAGTSYLNSTNNTSHITLNVANLYGSGTLVLGATNRAGQTVGANNLYNFNITSATGYTGVIDISKGRMGLTGDLLLSSAGITMSSTGASLLLDTYNLTVSSFTYGSTVLELGTYTSADLNTRFNTTAFSGDGNLIVAIPEASTAAWVAVIGFAGAFMAVRRSRTKAAKA